MIIFDLACLCGCQFEGWFQDRLDYDCQYEKGLLQCPACGAHDIHKILSPVSSVGVNLARRNQQCSPDAIVNPDTVPGLKELTQLVQSMTKYVKENYEDVGSSLAEKALKIHYGVEEEKKIRGVATAEEEKMLAGEGIHLLKLPTLVDDPEGEN